MMNRFTSVIVATVLLVSGQLFCSSETTVDTATKQSVMQMVMQYAPSKKLVAFTVMFAMYARLITKGSKWNYKSIELRSDWDELVVATTTSPKACIKMLIKLFDKWVIGRKLELEEFDLKTYREDGTVHTIKGDRRLAARPFGLMGLFDAYVLKTFEKVAAIGKAIEESNKFSNLVFGTTIINNGVAAK